MLDDRDYMRRRPEPENKLQTGLKCVYALIAINVMAFVFTIGQRAFAIQELWLSADGIRSGMFWQPLTAMFMHDGIGHIFFNMWGLYIFGGIVAPRLGGKAFLALYMSTGLLGNLLWLATAWNNQMPVVLCGASGAVMAVTAAAAVMAPETPMLLLFIPFPIKLRTMAIVFFALEIVMELSGGQAGVANLVHIVGFIGGYLFIKFFFRREMLWDPLYGPNFSTGSNFGFNGTRVSQRELDYLLDKISRTGINSLTEQELQRLRQAREEMRRN